MNQKNSSMRLHRNLDQFPEYIFSKLARKVKEVEQKSGQKVLNLAAGSPDIPPSPIYVKKLKELVADKTAHLYPGYGAIPELTDALTIWYKKRFSVNLKPDELFPLNGAKDGVSHIIFALLDKGDKILVPDPGYPGFSGPALITGAKVIPYRNLPKKILPKTKAIWVNFPTNPTGQVATLKELAPFVDFARKNNLVLIYDNAYSEITFDNFVAPSILQIDEAKKLAVEIGSFSKTFSMAGYRMGWIVGNSKIIAALAKVKSQFDSGLSLPLQKLGAFALSHQDQAWHRKMIATYQKRRKVIGENLEKLGLQFTLPKGSLYIWAKIPADFKDSSEFSNQLLERKHILVTPGSAFGKNGERFVRVSICVDIDNIDSYFE